MPTLVLAQQGSRVAATRLIGDDADDRMRLLDTAQYRGRPAVPDGDAWRWQAVSRRSMVLAGRATPGGRSLHWAAPTLRLSRAGAIPFGAVSGPLPLGRGGNAAITVGAVATYKWLDVQLLPQLFWSANAEFTSTTLRDPRAMSERWRFPFVADPSSIDLPIRFGDTPRTVATAGQSHVAVRANSLEAGVSHEVRWWGPGRRNALMLGSGHGGFPHAYLDVTRSIRSDTRLRMELITGRLRESPYFDELRDNDRRGIAGVQFALVSTTEARQFTLGVQRLVIRQNSATPLDAVRSTSRTRSQQQAGVFARTALPHGTEAWVEWMRSAGAASLRDFLEYPGRSQAYTFGLGWRPATRTRVEAEVTNAERDPSQRQVLSTPTYAGTSVLQGFTHEGRPLGAAIGPGSSSLWLAVDHFTRGDVRIGGFLQRIRWYNAYRSDPRLALSNREDVSLLVGVRTDRIRAWGTELGVSVATERRLNFLFGSAIATGHRDGTRDRLNHILEVRVSPAVTTSSIAAPRR
jgi:hypothetical protein